MTTESNVGTVVVIVDGGLVQGVIGDVPNLSVRVLDWDHEGEERDETARWLWENRDILRSDGPRVSRHTSPGEAKRSYTLRDEGFQESYA